MCCRFHHVVLHPSRHEDDTSTCTNRACASVDAFPPNPWCPAPLQVPRRHIVVRETAHPAPRLLHPFHLDMGVPGRLQRQDLPLAQSFRLCAEGLGSSRLCSNTPSDPSDRRRHRYSAKFTQAQNLRASAYFTKRHPLALDLFTQVVALTALGPADSTLRSSGTKYYRDASYSMVYLPLDVQNCYTQKGWETSPSPPQQHPASGALHKSSYFCKQRYGSSRGLEVFWAHHPNTHGNCYS
ncbi:uncharacterized protein LACBIDRAFT_329337 [Laccaria bicolor S238N-H82]|uniref:Predicted protein n=1 Tax=Laccaria bicolor (strain S238N-H82 / ATCC MYA-4686) TaxID=486041 RepID=B0DHQ4_LACBS|nr:uncharacterized protein LACBIDRAFT_329337 [Laccaria bicolor S238N-H82]EDR05768.1 predicted protein [Laccaria bicolor S238N-H82]|eukprot:XP_001883444.1 predicted protein [Laccaria bicolor S238N-H82]